MTHLNAALPAAFYGSSSESLEAAVAKLGCVVLAAALFLAGCGGESPGERPQEYQFDQDIDASHGAGIPTSSNPSARGLENWRMKDPDTYGYSQSYGR